MTNNTDKIIKEEKAERKELSRVRIFWFLIVANVLLAIYIVIQVLILIGK